MNELQSLYSEMTKYKESDQNKIPIELKEKIVNAIEKSDLSLKRAASIFNINPMTFYEWRRKL